MHSGIFLKNHFPDYEENIFICQFKNSLTFPDKKMMTIKKYIFAVLIIFMHTALSAQDNAADPGVSGLVNKSPAVSDTETKNSEAEKAEDLPSGFMNITLGLSMDSLEEALKENSYFDYRGKPDVDMRITQDRTLIECSGFSYVKKGYFQFYNEKLIVITIIIDEKELDYYSFYTNLERKYGKPHHLNPEGVYWENNEVSVALEKPLSVKYTDRKSFTEIKEKSAAKTSKQKELKEDFIENF